MPKIENILEAKNGTLEGGGRGLKSSYVIYGRSIYEQSFHSHHSHPILVQYCLF
jgi:hypothetical protein